MKEGDVVQFNSGGAPMTIIRTNKKGFIAPTRVDVAARSPGGLMHEISDVSMLALKLYKGELTPSAGRKERDRW